MEVQSSLFVKGHQLKHLRMHHYSDIFQLQLLPVDGYLKSPSVRIGSCTSMITVANCQRVKFDHQCSEPHYSSVFTKLNC